MYFSNPILLFAAMLVTVSCTFSESGQLQANKDLVHRFTEVTNSADWGGLAELVADDFQRHSAASEGPKVSSRDDFVQLQKSFLASFPDQAVTIEQLIAEGDYVAMRAVYRGTQSGPLGSFPATGRRVEAPFLGVFRVNGGLIAELWVEWDNLAMLKQLGLFPPSSALKETGS
ncbi:MAG: ester cyclase [Rubricoccaceae bacterium]|nr:ester cyclase [Rubricoccaceae bacterium]